MRREKISSLVTINRLTTENHSLKMQLSYAEDTADALRKTSKSSQPAKPRFTKDGVNQANFEGLFAIARKAHSQRSQSPISQNRNDS